jgi:hypothetical protein
VIEQKQQNRAAIRCGAVLLVLSEFTYGMFIYSDFKSGFLKMGVFSGVFKGIKNGFSVYLFYPAVLRNPMILLVSLYMSKIHKKSNKNKNTFANLLVKYTKLGEVY